MLRIDFINVGDGDAALIRLNDDEFTILVDTGRPLVSAATGSKRAHAIDFLMREGVKHIDLMILTHLHFDHMGGALGVMRHIKVDRMTALDLPPKDAGWIFLPEGDCERTVANLFHALNYFADTVTRARELGVSCELAKRGELEAPNGLRLTLYLPDDELKARQKAVFDSLYRGEKLQGELSYAASKERNISSLMLRIEYEGKSVLITGDAYGAYWQDAEMPPCDILKMPHHGDEKSMTESLIAKLHPSYAITSCQNDAVQKKERPAERTIRMIKPYVPNILCTENRQLLSLEASCNTAISLVIENGSVRRIDP